MAKRETIRATSAAEARQYGLTRYFTGRPCRHGHVAERYACDYACCVCTTIKVTRYQRADPKRHVARVAAWQKKNPDMVSDLRRIAYAKNGDRLREKGREYYRNNRGKFFARVKSRVAKIKRATPPWADRGAIEKIYERCVAMTESTGVVHHVDHIIPLCGDNVCGLHVESNLRVITAHENMRKSKTFVP
jgi:hypothetical protein